MSAFIVSGVIPGWAIDQHQLAPAVHVRALEAALKALVGAAAAVVAECALGARQRFVRGHRLRCPRALVDDVLERTGVGELLGHQHAADGLLGRRV
jgi:hypothetical protein